MNCGDTIVLYSDGFTEAHNKNNEMFRIQRLEKLIKIYGDKAPKQLIGKLVDEIRQFVGREEQYDDITLVALRKKDIVNN